jgi:hypothetical protein
MVGSETLIVSPPTRTHSGVVALLGWVNQSGAANPDGMEASIHAFILVLPLSDTRAGIFCFQFNLHRKSWFKLTFSPCVPAASPSADFSPVVSWADCGLPKVHTVSLFPATASSWVLLFSSSLCIRPWTLTGPAR